MTYRINTIAAYAVILAQLAASIATGSALAGIVAAVMVVIFAGPTQWERAEPLQQFRVYGRDGRYAVIYSSIIRAASADDAARIAHAENSLAARTVTYDVDTMTGEHCRVTVTIT